MTAPTQLSEISQALIKAATDYFKGEPCEFVGIRAKDWKGAPKQVNTLVGIQLNDGRYVLLKKTERKKEINT